MLYVHASSHASRQSTEIVQHASSYSGGKLFALVASFDVIIHSTTRVTMIHSGAWKGFGRSELARRCLNNIWRKLFQKYFLVGVFLFSILPQILPKFCLKVHPVDKNNNLFRKLPRAENATSHQLSQSHMTHFTDAYFQSQTLMY